jgi:hypothetical protein
VRHALGLDARVGSELGRIAHTITRFRIALELVEATLPAKSRAATRRPDVVSALPSELERHAMPTPHRKLVALLRSNGGER